MADERETPSAPQVVAVVVVHEPRPGLDGTLDALAAQDYPGLRVLVVDTSLDGGGTTLEPPVDGEGGRHEAPLVARLAAHLPEAFLHRAPGATPAAAANEVLRLVEGGGFFCLLHDDVVLDPDAVRLLVEELYRSNAGVVGPKLVDADDPARLQAVGLEADKFGELAPPTGAGELDQEQHDAVADTFAVPSACVLVRADLFRTLGGFDTAIDGPGDELDLCWRAHVSGARVLVVPAARARHRGLPTAAYDHLDERAPRNRLRAVLGDYSLVSLARVLPQLAVLSVVRSLAYLVTGRVRRAAQPIEAWAWNLARLPSLVRKRRAVARTRRVPDSEVRRLQRRGSARLAAALREASTAREERGARVAAGARSVLDQVRSGTHWPVTITWSALAAVVVLGSRSLLTDGVAPVGRLLAVDEGAADLLARPLSGWSPRGLGAVGPVAPGLGLLGLLSLVLGGATELARTLVVVAPLLVGPLGIWRLTRSFGVRRARLAAVVAYAANPLPYHAIAAGRWEAGVAYAALPWLVGGLARLAGWAPTTGARRPVAQTIALLALGLAVTGAAVPALVPVVLLTAALLALGSVAAGDREGVGALLGGTVLAAGGAVVLLLPWSWSVITDGWSALAGPPLTGPQPLDASVLARFAVGPGGTSPLTFGLWAAALAGLALGAGWRPTWGARGMVLAAGTLLVAVLGEHGSLPMAMPPVEVVLAPGAVGLAVAVAAAVAASELDVAGTRLTWRQPLVLVSILGVAVAAVPVLVGVTDGRWEQPRRGVVDDLALLPVRDTAGAFRTLWVGDPRVLPLPSWPLVDGLGWAMHEGLRPTVEQAWSGAPTDADEEVATALAVAADGRIDRLGRQLASRAVRFVVVATGAPAGAPSPPATLVSVLRRQLDLKEVDVGTSVAVFENEAWLPERAVLTGPARAASELAGVVALARADVSGASPVLRSDGVGTAEGPVPAGTVFAAVPFVDGWRLRVDGREVRPRPAFGWATAFEVPAAGRAVLDRPAPASRWVWVVAVALAWAVAVRLAWTGRLGPRRRRRAVPPPVAVAPVLALDEGPSADEVLAPLADAPVSGSAVPEDAVPEDAV